MLRLTVLCVLATTVICVASEQSPFKPDGDVYWLQLSISGFQTFYHIANSLEGLRRFLVKEEVTPRQIYDNIRAYKGDAVVDANTAMVEKYNAVSIRDQVQLVVLTYLGGFTSAEHYVTIPTEVEEFLDTTEPLSPYGPGTVEDYLDAFFKYMEKSDLA
nr:CP52k-like protein 13 [Membranobalanus longirostrum]